MTPYEEADRAYQAAFAALQAARVAYHRTRTIDDAQFHAIYSAFRDAETNLSQAEQSAKRALAR